MWFIIRLFVLFKLCFSYTEVTAHPCVAWYTYNLHMCAHMQKFSILPGFCPIHWYFLIRTVVLLLEIITTEEKKKNLLLYLKHFMSQYNKSFSALTFLVHNCLYLSEATNYIVPTSNEKPHYLVCIEENNFGQELFNIKLHKLSACWLVLVVLEMLPGTRHNSHMQLGTL